MTSITPNEDQAAALDAIERWWESQQPDSPNEFILAGLAGTGKTAMLPWVHDLIGGHIRYVTPTWKAAQVLTRRLGGRATVTSVHNLMYTPTGIAHVDGCAWYTDGDLPGVCDRKCTEPIFQYDPKEKPRLVVVDEASMVSGRMHDDLKALGVPLLLVGDHGQLPPVKSGYSVFGANGERCDARLETIQRQVADSPIIKLSRLVREGKSGWLEAAARMGIQVAESGKPGGYRLDEAHADGRAMIICATNKRRAAMNAKVRQWLGRKPGEPVVGDRLMMLDNDKRAGVYNGQCGMVDDVWDDVLSVRMEDGRRWHGRVNLDALDSVEEQPWDRTMWRWRWSYAVTCHKAQGSEWPKILLVHEGVRDDRVRWLYTAITRAKDELAVLLP